MFIRGLFIASLLALLTGCSATGKRFGGLENPESGYVHIYLYRPSSFQQSGIFPDIELDSKLVGKLKNGGYLLLKAKPGDHKLSITGNYLQWNHAPRTFDVQFEKGKTYFYRLQPFVAGLYSPVRVGGVYLLNHSYSFIQVNDEAMALSELEKLNESVDLPAREENDGVRASHKKAALVTGIVDEVKLLRQKDESSQLVVDKNIILKYLPIGMAKKSVIKHLESEGFEVHMASPEGSTLLGKRYDDVILAYYKIELSKPGTFPVFYDEIRVYVGIEKGTVGQVYGDTVYRGL